MISLVFLTGLLLGCTDIITEDITQNVKSLNTNKPLLDISYEITTSVDFKSDPVTLSSLDLSATNPSSEKQKIAMQLFENGQLNLTIEDLELSNKVAVLHQILPDTRQKITKTIITGTSAKYYNSKGELVRSEEIPLQNHVELANKIKEEGNNLALGDINETIANLQGGEFVANLNEFISTAADNNIQITQQGNGIITARIASNRIEPELSGDTVLLIDKNNQKLLGSKIYSTDNELLQSEFYAYSKDVLKAIQVKELYLLPSGKKTYKLSLSKIEHLKFNLNL